MALLFLVSTAIVLSQVGQAFESSWPDIVERVSPAIVVVQTEKGQGSGFFVRPDGTLVTNHHVIDGATQIAIRSASGEVYRGAFVLASDRIRDLAIIRVEGFDVPVAKLGNSNDIKVGTSVLLLGAPRGLEQSASNGIIAAVRMNDAGTRLIQTSAAASSGSSGGPMLNEGGEVVGVLSFSVTQSQNLNFAVPINYARGILDRLAGVATQPEARLAPLERSESNEAAPQTDEVYFRRV